MKKFFFLFIFINLINAANIAYGCSCARPNTPEVSASKADAVFTGKVLDKKQHEFYQLYEVTFKVNKSYKGDFGQEAVIRTSMASASCGFPFKGGKTYLVYAYEHKDQFREVFSTGICSRTRLFSDAKEDLAILKKMYK